MILEINQTNSAGVNTFEVMDQGVLLYKAESPWYPLMTDVTRKIRMFNPAGEQVFESRYSFLENVAESSIPFKYLFTGSQKFAQYTVIDTNGNEAGAFYAEQTELMKSKMVLQYEDRALVVYKRSIGAIEVACFYDGDTMVAQLTKSNKRVNNLDKYLLHILPDMEAWLPVMVFFVVYYDFVYHNNSGEIMVGTKISYTYTYDKNNTKYDPNFILNNFGQEEADRIAGKGPNSIVPPTTVGGMSMKTFWIIFGVGWGVAILIVAVVLIMTFVVF